MKLDTLGWVNLVPEPHDDIVIGPCGYVEGFRKTLGIDNERMVTRGNEAVRHVAENTVAAVPNETGLSVHQAGGVHDAAAEGCSDCLVSQANTEYRNISGNAPNKVNGDTGVLRPTRTRRDQHAAWCHRDNVFDGKVIVAKNSYLVIARGNEVDQVVGERVIVVKNEYHGILSQSQC